MGAISTRLEQDVSRSTFSAKTSRGSGMAGVFQALEATQKAVAALEYKVNALESRLSEASEN